jgi:hypothetical protein
LRETNRTVLARTWATARTPSHFTSAANASASLGSGPATAIIGKIRLGNDSLRAPGPGLRPAVCATPVSPDQLKPAQSLPTLSAGQVTDYVLGWTAGRSGRAVDTVTLPALRSQLGSCTRPGTCVDR